MGVGGIGPRFAPDDSAPEVAEPLAPAPLAARGAGRGAAAPERARPTRVFESTAEILRLFQAGTLPRADPRWLANPPPRYGIEGQELVIAREAWELSWPKDLPKTASRAAADVAGFAFDMHFDASGTAATYAVRGRRIAVAHHEDALETTKWKGLEAVALRSPAEALVAYFRFLPPAPPAKIAGILERNGALDAAFVLERRAHEVRVPLTDAKLAGLSADDVDRMWNDPNLTCVPLPEAHAGRWDGRILLDDPGAARVADFKHQAWRDERLGMVGTFSWPALLRHGGMLIREGAEGTRLDFFPRGFKEELRAVHGNPNVMLGRFRFLLRDKDGKENTQGIAFYRTLAGKAGAALEKLFPGHATRTDDRGNTHVEGYYVLIKRGEAVDPAEKVVFALDRKKLEKEYGKG